MPYFSKVTLNPIPNWSGLQFVHNPNTIT
ncbi:hypothetical protein AC4HA13_0030 [Escherichia phage vB_EcoM_4HA13]|uniref:Uncharacterized protein n=1 Tax=Escherichia phage vB_EcoM_4HA13 TaxID=2601675 RepID=A0A8F4TDI0_9CAUD|nr:hypothetical protein HYP96_gp30 [Escherichia phage vB_EcoM_4HA13]QXG07484.1 hypothetical protein AC4HA13_0030 [Escherichia phage vB_EcoM_4HA13]